MFAGCSSAGHLVVHCSAVSPPDSGSVITTRGAELGSTEAVLFTRGPACNGLCHCLSTIYLSIYLLNIYLDMTLPRQPGALLPRPAHARAVQRAVSAVDEIGPRSCSRPLGRCIT